MKRIFTIGFLLLAGTGRTQTTPEVCNLLLTDSSMRILYIGVDNNLKISGLKNPEEIKVTVSGGGADIRQQEPFRYIVRANAVGQSTLSVYQRGKLVKTIVYNVLTLGPALAGLNRKRNITLRKSEILATPWLNLFIENAQLKMNYQVVSFNMNTELNGDSLFMEAKGNQLNQQQLNTIRQLNSGTMILFEDIRVNGPDGRTTKAEPFWIKIE